MPAPVPVARRLALATLGVAPVALLVASFGDGLLARLAAAVAASGLVPAAMLLGLGNRPSAGAVRAILALWLLLTGSLAGVVILAGWPSPGPLGLPWGSLLAVAGLTLAPLVLVSWSYAATFERRGRRPAAAPPPQPPSAGGS